MATAPSVDTLAVGDKLTATRWNKIATAIAFIEDPPRATVYRSANQSISSGTTTLVTWDTEDEDTNSIHSTSTNTSRLTVQTDGAYLVDAKARWASFTGGFTIDVRKNAAGSSSGGTSVAALTVPAVAITGTGGQLTKRITGLVTGDYLEMFVNQGSGGAVNLLGGAVNLSMFAIQFVGTN